MLLKTHLILSMKRLVAVLCLVVLMAVLFSLTIYHQSTELIQSLKTRQGWFVEKQINLSALDLFTLRDSEKAAFLSYKENIYNSRRDRVHQYCQYMLQQRGGKKGPSYKVRKDTIIYDEKDSIAYCQIPKVASSTWCKHFAILSGASPSALNEWRNAIQLFAPELWPLPRDGRLLPELFEEMDLSLVIVRHPFSRLASIYYEKLIFNNGHAWDYVSEYIIDKFRKTRHPERNSLVLKPDRPINQNLPTPEEFLHYVLECLMNDDEDTNPHWLPQYKSCPFCLVNFTVYSKMEEMYEDTAYIMHKVKLFGKILPELKDNSSMKKGDGREYEFWKDVPLGVVKKLYSHYKPDLEMFDYSFRKYFEDLKIEFS